MRGNEVPKRYEHRGERAFPGLFPPEYEQKVREILSNTRRSRRWIEGARRPPPTSNALRYARCLFELEPGHACNRVIRPLTRSAHHAYDYVGMGCYQMRPRHRTIVPAALDDHVLDIVRSVFTPKRMEALRQHVRASARAYGQRVQELEAELAQVRKGMDAATDELVELRFTLRNAKSADARQSKQKLLKVWQQKLEVYQSRETAVEGKLMVLEFQEREFSTARDEDLEKIVSLAVNLPLLLERARAVPGALSRILYEVIHLVRVRSLGQGVYELRMELQDGLGEVRRVFWHGNIRYPQPAALYAYERIAAGEAAADVAAYLRRVFVHGRHRAQWLPRRVEGAAAYHEYFRENVSREGPHRCQAELVAQTGLAEDVVACAMLEGRFGPAKWQGGQLLVCPTETELHEAFPDFARREVARLHDLDADNLMETSDLYAAGNGTKNHVQYVIHKRLDRWSDAAGRFYVLRSAAEREGLKTERLRIPREPWGSALKAAVAALGRSDLKAEDFISQTTVLKALRTRFPFVTRHRIVDAIERGHLTAVTIPNSIKPGSTSTRLRHYVHVPPEVLTTSDPDVVRRWLWKDGRPPQRATGAL